MNSVGTFASQQHNGPICQLPLRHQWTATKTAGNSQEQSPVLCSVAQESEPVYSIISVLFFHDEQQQESSYSNPRQISQYGTIPILRQHILDFFLSPPTHYVSINIVMSIFKNGHFPNSPTLSFCWRNIGMVPIWPASKKSPCNPEFLWSWMCTVGHHFAFSSLEKIYTKLFSLYFFKFSGFLLPPTFPLNAYSIKK